MTTTETETPIKPSATEEKAKKVTKGKSQPKVKGARKGKAGKGKAVTYSNEPPRGLWPVGTIVRYAGGAKLRNDWLKKGAVGRVFGYRPGKTGGGLYAVRFEGGATLLSTKRVERAPAPKAK
jgi:hypothetical protein